MVNNERGLNGQCVGLGQCQSDYFPIIPISNSFLWSFSMCLTRHLIFHMAKLLALEVVTMCQPSDSFRIVRLNRDEIWNSMHTPWMSTANAVALLTHPYYCTWNLIYNTWLNMQDCSSSFFLILSDIIKNLERSAKNNFVTLI